MKKVIIDTDPGHDDALAIMLAVKSEIIDIKAITTVAGNSSIENTTRNSRYILDLLEREDIPIYSGSKKPLKRKLVRAVVHGKSGLEGIDPEIESNLTGNAVEKILEIIKDNPNEITLVTLGPLTNIAKAIIQDNKTIGLVKEIVMMGGAIKAPGNKNRVAEFNIFVDPEAAEIVFKSPYNKFLIPLDACNNVKMKLSDFNKIRNKKLKRPILNMMKPFIKNIFEDEGTDAALVYDALTIYYSIKPEVCKTQNYNIAIETKGELTRGMTVADLRKKPNLPPNSTVIKKIPKEQFINDFINTLNSN